MTAREDPITVSGDLTISDRLDMEDGTLVNQATITITSNAGHVHLMSGTSITGGAIIVQNGGTLSVEGGILDQGTITVKNGGTLIVESGGDVYRKDITVEAGGLLVSQSGALFKFEASEGIFSSGKLEINGGTFEKYGTGNWDYVYLSGAGANGSYIRNATISGSTYGIHTANADNVTIENVSSTANAIAGLKLYGTFTADILSSAFDNNGTHGV